jgi:hypothetical protein
MRSDDISNRVSELIDKISRDLPDVKALAWIPEKFVEYAADVGELRALAKLVDRAELQVLARGVIKEWERVIGEKDYGAQD